MGKSRADIQKAYRERKKAKEGSKYMRNETERVKRYYKRTTEIGPNKLKIRRERVRLCMKRKRQALKQEIIQNQGQRQDAPQVLHVTREVDVQSDGPCDSTTSSSVQELPGTSTSSKLVVDMKFPTRRGSWKKSKSLKTAEQEIKVLELRVNSLKKTNNSLRKKISRSSTMSTPDESHLKKPEVRKSVTSEPSRKRKNTDGTIDMTPKSKSKLEIRKEGLSPKKHRRLMKKLVFHNTLVEEVKGKLNSDRGRARQRSTLQTMCGKVMKKYRLMSMCSLELGVNRGQISKSEKRISVTKRRNALKRAEMATQVINFLEREDNSACLPGKRDVTKVKAGSKQTRVLNDFLYNMHLKFKSENPNLTISLTTFSSYRPSYIKLVKYSARRTCLCQKHQNMALKMKGLKSAGAVNTDNPDMLARLHSDDEILQKIAGCDTETIKFAEWKRKEVQYKGKLTRRMMIGTVELPKDAFIELFRQDLIAFRKHIERVKSQYEQIKNLKEKLPQNHAICQMDFAENYSCGHAEEIQTAYFDKCSVTLHPVVLYTRNTQEALSHISYIYVSDTTSHNSGTVYAFIKRITNDLKTMRPDIECIHYVTDSPTSQYRNKAMMYVVANHNNLFGMNASWQYWEAGHGKGPCDGVGGTSKRLADLAVKRHTTIIQSAEDYYRWGHSLESSQTKYCFVPKEECDNAYLELSSLSIKPIKGTLEIHSVVHMKPGQIAVRNTSCFCDKCFVDGDFKASCEGWIVHSVTNVADCGHETELNQRTMEENTDNEENNLNVSHEPATSVQNDLIPINSFVAAMYNGIWYIGKVIAHDSNDEDLPYQISFMEHGKGKVCYTLKWPSKDDIIWRARTDILCVINEPISHGTRKMFKVTDSDAKLINEAFENYK